MILKPLFISSAQYHCLAGWSSTQIKAIVKHSIDKALVPTKDTPSLSFGRAMHDYFDSPKLFESTYAVFDDTKIVESILARRPDITAPLMTKDYKVARQSFEAENEDKHILSKQEYETIVKMHESAYSLPFIKELLPTGELISEGTFLDTYTTDHSEFTIRARPDLIVQNGDDSWIIDWKSCKDASAKSFRSDFYSYRYDVQAVFYSLVTGIDPRKFAFVAIEKEYPYASAVYTLSDQTIELALDDMNEALDRIGKYEFLLHSGMQEEVSGLPNSTGLPVCI